MNHVNIFALGGQDENGKNSYVFEYNDEIFVINAGVKIPINSQNGVDTLIPDFGYLESKRKKIKGIFISDVKNETFSALPWLVLKIPNLTIYTSAFNKWMIIDRLNKYKINPKDYKIVILNARTKIGSLEVMPIPLTGSMPGNNAFDFITPNGDYLFMFNYVEGNLGIYGRTSFSFLKKLLNNRKIVALISDAGKSNFSGKAIDKLQLPSEVLDIFEKTNKESRIIVGAYDEEMVVLQQILDLAKKYNRPVAPYGKTYGQLLDLLKKANPELEMPEFIDYKKVSKHKNAVILVTGSIERLYLRFMRITDEKDVYLKILPTDTVLMLAPPVNGLESTAAVVLDNIAKNFPILYDIPDNEYYRNRPTKEDISNLVNMLEPEHFIPTQGLYRYLADAIMYVENNLKKNQKINSISLSNGRIAHFVDGKLFSTNGKVKPVGDLIIDGFGVGDISSEVISEREALGREGVVIINSIYSPKTKKIISNLHINYIGVIDESDKDKIDTLVKETIIKVFQENDFTSLKEVTEKLRKSIRKRIFKLTDKDPMVAVTFTTI
ncbi:hydrolase [Mycoplasmopsis gallinacea]|uniref:Hydrolase n=1 Tax=Mycoplasmopsis gallinacea TaxID=29556 RepID=A0A0D5ZKB3_9BACT|nr:hydrolase [Mycoplasmopsis gallinacea]